MTFPFRVDDAFRCQRCETYCTGLKLELSRMDTSILSDCLLLSELVNAGLKPVPPQSLVTLGCVAARVSRLFPVLVPVDGGKGSPIQRRVFPATAPQLGTVLHETFVLSLSYCFYMLNL